MKTVFYLFPIGQILLLLIAPTAAYAQMVDDPAPIVRDASSTDGLFLHARLGGHGIAYENAGDAEGGGLGLRAGYGFSDRFTLYLGIEGAGVKGGRGFEGLEANDDYGLVYLELGSRFHFRRGRQLVPYADLAVSVIGVGYEGTGSYAQDDITYGGAGLSLGGGVLYFLSETIALDGGLSFTPGSLMEVDIDGRTEDVDIALTGARLHVGITLYPFR